MGADVQQRPLWWIQKQRVLLLITRLIEIGAKRTIERPTRLLIAKMISIDIGADQKQSAKRPKLAIASYTATRNTRKLKTKNNMASQHLFSESHTKPATDNEPSDRNCIEPTS